MDKKMIKNTDEAVETVDVVASETADAENGVKTDSGNKRFRGILTAAVLVSFVVFVSLLIYFCENTGA